MKIMKSLIAVSILAAVQANAAVYNVTGSQAGANTKGATVDPSLFVHAGSTSYSTSASNFPTFSGSWDINTAGSSGSVTGIFGNFVQYSTSVSAGFGLTAVINQPHVVYSFSGGTVSYNAGTRTFTLGQPLVYSNSDAAINNDATSDAKLTLDVAHGAAAGVCSGASVICNNQATYFINKPDLERFYMTLTFSPDFSSFTGTAVGADVGGGSGGTATGNTWYSYNFTGTAAQPAVPVPAAAWLFGSGLMGLAGVARRRRAK